MAGNHDLDQFLPLEIPGGADAEIAILSSLPARQLSTEPHFDATPPGGMWFIAAIVIIVTPGSIIIGTRSTISQKSVTLIVHHEQGMASDGVPPLPPDRPLFAVDPPPANHRPPPGSDAPASPRQSRNRRRRGPGTRDAQRGPAPKLPPHPPVQLLYEAAHHDPEGTVDPVRSPGSPCRIP